MWLFCVIWLHCHGAVTLHTTDTFIISICYRLSALLCPIWVLVMSSGCLTKTLSFTLSKIWNHLTFAFCIKYPMLTSKIAHPTFMHWLGFIALNYRIFAVVFTLTVINHKPDLLCLSVLPASSSFSGSDPGWIEVRHGRIEVRRHSVSWCPLCTNQLAIQVSAHRGLYYLTKFAKKNSGGIKLLP